MMTLKTGTCHADHGPDGIRENDTIIWSVYPPVCKIQRTVDPSYWNGNMFPQILAVRIIRDRTSQTLRDPHFRVVEKRRALSIAEMEGRG
jgi:hypothetical protein